MGVSTRDVAAITLGLTRWWAAHRPDGAEVVLTVEPVTAGGYSNEMLFVRAGTDDLVVRLPPDGPAVFPDYDLRMQADVQALVGGHGVPVPAPIVVEADPSWLGAPFLVMPRCDGSIPGDLPAFDRWIADAPPDRQRALHEAFLDVLATIHRTPFDGSPHVERLRRPPDLAAELSWWEALVAWTFDGAIPSPFATALEWCRLRLPPSAPPPSVLWGDVRLGNVIFDDDLRPVAVLDWEMASIGPAELDLGWYLATEALGAHFVDRRVPGFLSRDEVVARHEVALGRPLADLDWHEAFALVRTAILSGRTNRVAALRRGRALPDPANDPVLVRTLEVLGSSGA